MSVPSVARWTYSDADGCAHVLAGEGAEQGTLVTRCLKVLSDTVVTYPTAPSMNVCGICGTYAALPAPEHATRSEQAFPLNTDWPSVP